MAEKCLFCCATKNGRVPPDGRSMAAARQTIHDMIADRLDDMEQSGLVDIDYSDDEDIQQLQLTSAEWRFFRERIFKELFAKRPSPPRRSSAPPGSDERIADYAARAAHGYDIYHAQDATLNERKVRAEVRANGCNDNRDVLVKILGWADGDDD